MAVGQVYRCYIIRGSRWYVIALPALTFVASSGAPDLIRVLHLVEHSLLCLRVFLFFLAVLAILTVVESAIPNTSLLRGKPIHLAVPWVSLSVSLNVIVTSMICFRLLRMRARVRGMLSPETSRMYTSVAATLIESAAPLSILGIGLVITAAKNVPPTFAFAYVWTMFCVEFKSSHAPFGSMPKTNLTDLCLTFLSVPLPANDHPPCCDGPWVAQGDWERYQHGVRIHSIPHGPRTKSRGTRDDLQYGRPDIWTWNTCGVRHVN